MTNFANTPDAAIDLETLAALSNDELDLELDGFRYVDPDGRSRACRDLFAERTRRIARRQQELRELDEKVENELALEAGIKSRFDRAVRYVKKDRTLSGYSIGLVTCPKCGAGVGVRCSAVRAGGRTKYAHTERVNAARAWSAKHGIVIADAFR